MDRHLLASIVKPDSLSPFSEIDGLDEDDFREAAYEVFFTACRSSPGFGGRNAAPYYNAADGEGNAAAPGSPVKHHGVGMAVTSRVKAALGLKMLRRSLSSSSFLLRRVSSNGMNPSSPMAAGSSQRVGSAAPPGGRMRRPMTSAEIMRQQMNVTEQSDNRLRKTLTRSLVGQMGKRAEAIMLPLELLRHLKPSEFRDPEEYHLWQLRQLKILEAGLLLHPSTPLEKSNPHASKLRNIIRTSESQPIDTGKNSRTMKMLSDCVLALARRGPEGTDMCHWADGYPLNVHIYIALLQTVFDMRDETLVLDEVDELLELMKKTWPMLGFNRIMHNLCFAWVLFQQFFITGMVEQDLLGASLAMMKEVENDIKKVDKVDRDPVYMKMLASVMTVMRNWSEKRLLDYHANFNREMVGLLENMLPFLFPSAMISEEVVPIYAVPSSEKREANDELTGNRVDHCIRSSLRNAFAKMVEEEKNKSKNKEAQLTSETLIRLAVKTQELAAKEKDIFSPVLKKWSLAAAGIASLTLHTYYGILLKQYIASKSWQLNEILLVLNRAGKLEKALVEMVVEESKDCDDEGKGIVRQMDPYEVESTISRLLKQWIQESLQRGREQLLRAKQTETWNPQSKTEPHAHSAVELVTFAKEVVDSFFQIKVNVPKSLFYDFINGLEDAFLDYISFVSSCGSKQNYLPTIPPLTRSSRGSTLFKLWKKAACNVAVEDRNWDLHMEAGDNQSRVSTSRGTQRLYVRLNSLQFLISALHSLEIALSAAPNVTRSKTLFGSRRQSTRSYFEKSFSTLQTAFQHVSKVAAHRLIFLDLNSVFYGSLYAGSVARVRIGPAAQSLKHNLALLCTIVVERAQPLALKEVVKASFEAFVRVLLTGGGSWRMFTRADHPMIEEDLNSLKRVLYMCGEGLIAEDMVEREAEAAQEVVELMGQSTEQLIEEFISTVNGGHHGMNISSPNHKIPVPPTTGNWNRSDPDTILRVLCSRKDRVANDFLKNTLHLPARVPLIKML